MEVDETAENAGQREVEEEVGLRVKPGPLLGVYSRPAPNGPGILVVVFRSGRPTGRLRSGERWGPLVPPDDIPWDEPSNHPWGLRDWVKAAALGGSGGASALSPPRRLSQRRPFPGRPDSPGHRSRRSC
jgi:8-oxo-dGTP pyrophosphatase MutT (NUDIX family)